MAALEIQDLRKSFVDPAGRPALVVDIPQFAIDTGEQVGLAGTSGSGKTTLLHLIAGILQADSGRIRVAGLDMTGVAGLVRDRIRAQHIGYIFQTFNLLQGYTALENVELGMMFGRGLDSAYARRLLDRVGLGDRLHYRPRQLSVGQQQRVAVARALANHPDLVLADEPTGNLDARHSLRALELIQEICRETGAALLLVSHDQAVLSAFQRVEDLQTRNCAAASGQPAQEAAAPPHATASTGGS
ncbi:MAG: ABC transporter ATP-binding protein [Planctomycetes bacterium]|nr:ABC transporter ATP-binding protein [Planctomycetota bacterium]